MYHTIHNDVANEIEDAPSMRPQTDDERWAEMCQEQDRMNDAEVEQLRLLIESHQLLTAAFERFSSLLREWAKG